MRITTEEPQYFQDPSTRSWHLEDQEMADKRACDNCRALMAARKLDPLPDDATAADVAPHLQMVAAKLIKAEIETDPEGRGYAGKTDQEVADLLNAPYLVTVVIGRDETDPDNPVDVTRRERRRCRVAVALDGIPYVPNAVTDGDVLEARNA